MNAYEKYVTAEEAHPPIKRPQDTTLGRALLSAQRKTPNHAVAQLVKPQKPSPAGDGK